MNIELPLYGQAKPNTCALSCLRMVLAAFGTDVEEPTLEAEASMLKHGVPVDELERLARHYHLVAKIQETTVDDLGRILAEGRLAITYLDRAIFDMSPRQRSKHSIRNAKIHVVMPSHIDNRFVTYHDPLPPRIVRKSIRLFQQAHELLGNCSVVCSKPDS